MSLTPADIVVFGPFGIDFKLVGASKKAYTGIKGDSLTLSLETKLGNAVFEDGTEEDWEEGRKLVGELVLSEFDPVTTTGDLWLIESCDNCVITFTNGKVITIAATCRFFTSMENGKMKVQIFKTVALGNDLSGLVAIS
jgi:hypothetical protein